MKLFLKGPPWRNYFLTLTLTLTLTLALTLPTGIILARGLGPLVGEFTLHPLKNSLAKTAARNDFDQAGVRAHAIARLADGFDPSTLTSLNWTVVNAFKGIATLEGDLNSFGAVQDLPGILELKLARTLAPTMDAARKLSHVDEILNWGPRPNLGGVSGKGVLVGIVDFGFDTHHPAFLDAKGKTRFFAIWDPNLATTKGAPYNRGQVRLGPQLELEPNFGQNEGDHHGTNVASIAAGSDRTNPYYGIAPEATLIGVNLSSKKESADLEANVMNGISWIFHIADSLKMPAVVNLSLGNSHMGPHDGTSLFDRFIDSISGPGHIVVGALGNDGDKKLHASFTLAKSGETTGTFCPIPASIDLWGEVGKPFKVQVLIMDSASKQYQVSSVYQSTSFATGKPWGDSIVWTHPTTKVKQSFLVFLVMQRANAGNGKPHAEVIMVPGDKNVPENTEYPMLGIRILGTGTLQAWNGTSKPFSSQGIPGFVDGDNKMTLSEIGGTAKTMISVGSYTSTVSFSNYTGKLMDSIVNQNVGELSTWSSLGPAADGRIKPDLCAPGRVVVGALSSALVAPPPWLLSRVTYWPDQTNFKGRYFATEGTSLSAPLVAGVVAMMLEKSPKLTPAMAKDFLTKTTYKDSFTGSLLQPNSSWGAGKLDATAALVQSSGGTVWASKRGKFVRIPRATFSNGYLTIKDLVLPDKLTVTVSDWNGRWVSNLSQVQGNRFSLNSLDLPRGLYFARINLGQERYTLPFLH